MSSLRAILWPTPLETRLLVTLDESPILKACLAPLDQTHPAALSALLESLSLWQTRQLFAVLAADDPQTASCRIASQPASDRVVLEQCFVAPRGAPRAGSFSDLARLVRHVAELREGVRHAP